MARKRSVGDVIRTHRDLPQAPREHACAAGVCDPRRNQGLRAPAPKGNYTLITLKGPGVFLGAQVTKQGGASGLTFVGLDIDGRNVTSVSFAAASNWGLREQNPYGLVLLQGLGVTTMTIGFPTPLRFASQLQLSVTVNENGVAQILSNVITGTA